ISRYVSGDIEYAINYCEELGLVVR
ncbi:hypothetical protein LCGC14_2791590, partial [marine sediment metagenome]